MSQTATPPQSAPRPQLPAEVLYIIAGYCFPTWSDHELWFRLGHSTHVFRSAVIQHVVKSFSDRQTALHTKFEKHCEGRIIRDAASVTRIESYLKAPVAITSRAPMHETVQHDADDNDDEAPENEGTTHDGAPRTHQREWIFQAIDGQDQGEAVFETRCNPGADRDMLTQDAAGPSGPKAGQPAGPETEATRDWQFSCKALSLETAETGKIEFDNIQMQAKWVKVEREDQVLAGRGRLVHVAFDWREIWSRKLGRERYCQLIQTEKQKKFKQEVEERRQKLLANAAVARASRPVTRASQATESTA